MTQSEKLLQHPLQEKIEYRSSGHVKNGHPHERGFRKAERDSYPILSAQGAGLHHRERNTAD